MDNPMTGNIEQNIKNENKRGKKTTKKLWGWRYQMQEIWVKRFDHIGEKGCQFNVEMMVCIGESYLF